MGAWLTQGGLMRPPVCHAASSVSCCPVPRLTSQQLVQGGLPGAGSRLAVETSGHGALRENRWARARPPRAGGARDRGMSLRARSRSMGNVAWQTRRHCTRHPRPPSTGARHPAAGRYLDDGAYLAVKAVIELVGHPGGLVTWVTQRAGW